jgi:nickel/cobalt transporter (NicO) family protein
VAGVRIAAAGALLLVALLALLTLAAPASAQLTGAPANGESAESEAAPPSLFGRIAGGFMTVQSEVNRTINHRLVAIKREHSLTALLLGLAIAFAYGVFHAVGPGHGKAVLLSYFLSQDAKISRGVWMGAQIAFFHVVSAIVIVVVVHLILQHAFGGPVDELDFLKIASYGAITLIGAAMLRGAFRRLRRAGIGHDHAGHHHDHDAPGHVHDETCGHVSPVQAWREGGLLSVAVGLIPCSGAVLILVYCLANGLLLSGVLMAGAIAVGMAITLSVIGIAAIFGRQRALATAERRGRSGSGRPRAALGLIGPALITLFGAAMLVGSF